MSSANRANLSRDLSHSQERWLDWPSCPRCQRLRQTVCPVCERASTDFLLGYSGDEETVWLLCEDCSEAFQPEFYRHCENCGHQFPDGLGGHERDWTPTMAKLSAVGLGILMLVGAVLIYVNLIYRTM